MASRSSWSRLPPITLSAATRDRRHHQADELYAARADVCGRYLVRVRCTSLPVAGSRWGSGTAGTTGRCGMLHASASVAMKE